jgi:proteasome beta subunit
VTNGTAEWVDGRFTASGNGAPFAHALLWPSTYKVIDEAIEVGAYGLGHPIDLWQLTASGMTRSGKPSRTRPPDSVKRKSSY